MAARRKSDVDDDDDDDDDVDNKLTTHVLQYEIISDISVSYIFWSLDDDVELFLLGTTDIKRKSQIYILSQSLPS